MIFVEPRKELVDRLRQIARDLLLDRALFVRPFRVGILDVLHARRVEAQGDVQIRGRDGSEVLRDVLLGVGVAVAAEPQRRSRPSGRR